ncbi:MAG: AsnC family transcriptional regulator [Alphaproteobacteria bacterium]|nr:AsnC family transcriptional regulator [Alphaproteobacteria bacterium]
MARHPMAANIALNDLDRRIVNVLQEGFPLVAAPFAAVAAKIDIPESQLIARLQRMTDTGVVTRFGPFLDAAAMGGAFCLCAVAAPADRFEEIAGIVDGFPQVAHNYEREHALNMWFVLATESPEEIDSTALRIEQATGLAVLRFPKLEEFFIGFRVAA